MAGTPHKYAKCKCNHIAQYHTDYEGPCAICNCTYFHNILEGDSYKIAEPYNYKDSAMKATAVKPEAFTFGQLDVGGGVIIKTEKCWFTYKRIDVNKFTAEGDVFGKEPLVIEVPDLSFPYKVGGRVKVQNSNITVTEKMIAFQIVGHDRW